MKFCARLREVLSYDPETGDFTRIVGGSGTNNKIGAVAGDINFYGYRRIMIDGRRYLAHRLAWRWMTGEWPVAQIDHRNLDKADNRWTNLREATNAQNKANTPAFSTNTSGYKGVSWAKKNKKWRAQITVSGEQIFLGYRDTKEECAALYAAAASEHYGDFARVA